MELNLLDFERLDHRQHAVGGAIIAAGTRLGVEVIAPDAPKWVKIVIPLAATAIIGGGKEYLDSRDPENHTSETGDFLATMAGGGFVVMVVDLRW